MTKKRLINAGAVLLIAAIAMTLLIPALRGTEYPGREQMQDMKAYQRDRERRNLLRERPLVFLNGLLYGAGLACIIVALTCRGNREGPESRQGGCSQPE